LKIVYLKHSQIDKVKWDECIDHSTNRMVYAQSWYLDLVCRGWDAMVSDDYEAVMPLIHGKKFGIKYLYQPFFTQQLGVFARNTPKESLVEEFLSAIPTKFRYVDIALNKMNRCQHSEFQLKNFVNYELNLELPYPELLASYSANTKRNINKAVKYMLSVQDDINPLDLIDLFRKNMGQNLKHIKTEHYDFLNQIMEISLNEKKAKILGVSSPDGALCAAAFFLESYDSYIFLFSATNEESKGNGAMFLIIDQFIRKHAGEKLILDFEGSNIKSLARFYKSFGAHELNYPRIKKNKLPGVLKFLKS